MSEKQDDTQLQLFDTPSTNNSLPTPTSQLLGTTNFGAQTSLPLDGDVAPKPIGKTAEQQAVLEAVLQAYRVESAAILQAAIAISGQPYKKLTEVPTPLLGEARAQALGDSSPPADDKPAEAAPIPAQPSSKQLQQVYKPWTEDRKLRERGRRLNERINKRFSLPDLLHPALQEAVLKNPEYFGVCPLPSEETCPVNPDQRLRWLRAEEAKAYEAQLRAQE